MTKLTRKDCADAIESLALIHGRKYDEGERDAMSRMWLIALDGVTKEELQAAVRRYLKSPSTWWPTPGTLREDIVSRRPPPPMAEPEDVEPAPPGLLRQLLAEQGIDLPEPKEPPPPMTDAERADAKREAQEGIEKLKAGNGA